jgi:hypothetical protein
MSQDTTLLHQQQVPILIHFKEGTNRQQRIEDTAFLVQQLACLIQKCDHVRRIEIPPIPNDQGIRGIQPDPQDQGDGQQEQHSF